MKMTTEQFLSHLGIEVGKPFTLGGKQEYRVVNDERISVQFLNIKGEWQDGAFDLSDLLDCEITPLPKYILTEDEKAIVRSLPTEYTSIARSSDRSYLMLIDIYGGTNFSMFVNLFTFIKGLQEVSLDELRKCL